MEKSRLPKLKNKNFLETHIRRFNKINDFIENIEEEKYSKLNQIDILKKNNILEDKIKKYVESNQRLYSVKHHLHTKNNRVVGNFENELIKKKLKLEQTSKLLYDNFKINSNITSPLNERYKMLISNIDYNKRCFRNLSNKDFDSIFKDKTNLSQEPIIDYKKWLNSKSSRSKNKKTNKRNQEVNTEHRNKKLNIYKLSTTTNFFENRLKNYIKKNNNNSKNLNSTSKSKTNIINSTIYSTYQKTASKSSNNKKYNKEYFNRNGKFKKFVFLLKKQYDKNTKLLNEVKKQEKNSRDILLVSLAKLNKYKYKKF